MTTWPSGLRIIKASLRWTRARSPHRAAPPRHLRGVGGACGRLGAVRAAGQWLGRRGHSRGNGPPPPPPRRPGGSGRRMGAPLTGACSCEAGVREAAASVRGPCVSLGRGAPACQRRQSVRSARCWELVHLGALDDGSATHLLRHTGGCASARRSAPTHPTAPIPQDHLRHALAASTGRGAPDRPPVSES